MTFLEDGEIDEYDSNHPIPYVHLDILGEGNSGLVEKVQHKTTKQLYARKKLISPRRKQANQETVFHNEINAIRKLCTHHHFVRVVAAYKTKQHFGIILEPVADGGDLSEYLEQYWENVETVRAAHGNRAELENMRRVLECAFGCLASALAFMHDQHIRHKDIKPQNVLVHRSNVLFTDFGYCLDSSQRLNSATEGKPKYLTRRYSAPEVIDYEKRDSRSDVWSLGCVLLELLSAVTSSFEIDAEELFSTSMEKIHATMWAAEMPARFLLLPKVLAAMTRQDASDRPSSQDAATQLLSCPDFSYSKCRKMFDSKELVMGGTDFNASSASTPDDARSNVYGLATAAYNTQAASAPDANLFDTRPVFREEMAESHGLFLFKSEPPSTQPLNLLPNPVSPTSAAVAVSDDDFSNVTTSEQPWLDHGAPCVTGANQMAKTSLTDRVVSLDLQRHSSDATVEQQSTKSSEPTQATNNSIAMKPFAGQWIWSSEYGQYYCATQDSNGKVIISYTY